MQGQKQRPYRRRWRNLLLKPSLQVKLGLYYVLFSGVFALVVGGMVYNKLEDFVPLVLELTDVREEVEETFTQYFKDLKGLLLLALSVFTAANVALSIFFTHRLIGPTYAFRRHIQALRAGNYQVKTLLRRGDAFQEVADELNHLSDVLTRNAGPGSRQTGKAEQGDARSSDATKAEDNASSS